MINGSMVQKSIIGIGMGILIAILFLIVGTVGFLPWATALGWATILLTIVGWIFHYLLKRGEKPITHKVVRNKETIMILPKPQPSQYSEEEVKEPKMVIDQAPIIREGKYVIYEIEFEEGDNLEGEISADGSINVFLVTRRNLTKFENDEKFWYEDGEEEVARATIDFVAPKNGKWFLIVENIEDEPVTADIRLYIE